MMLGWLAQFGAACQQGNFFSFPTWYKYLPQQEETIVGIKQCKFLVEGLNDYALIALGILDIALRLAGFLAVIFVIVGGFRYLVSRGEPEHTKAALTTILNALIGLAITIVASGVVTFIAGRI